MVQFSFDIYDSLLLVGIIQGFILLVLLLLGKLRQQIATYFLAGTLLIFSLYNLLVVAYDVNFFAHFPSLHNLPLNLILGLGPCIYFYVFHALYPSVPLRKRWWIHFIPVSAQILFYLLLLINPQWVPFGGLVWKRFSQTEQLGALVSICLYSYKAIQQLKLHRKQRVQPATLINVKTITTLYRIVGAYLLLWAVWLAYTLIDIYVFDYSIPLRAYFPLYLLVSGLTYWIGTIGFLYPPIISSPDPVESTSSTFAYLKENDIQQYLKQLEELMNSEKMYLNTDLNLRQLAQRLGCSSNLLSFLINHRLHQSYPDWVNTYRIEEVKQRLDNPANRHLTLEGIAFTSGFNSKATFNRVFKQRTGLTPLQYIKKMRSQCAQ